ncbi:MAG TPA: ABC transporter ATP-binding protein, partial [Longimicrobiales bacterium]|nr:ABC transporter ATP-binding protein [Longimicrobiales bacterium]
PWTFHLQRNSAQLFNNISNEVGLFTTSVTFTLTLLAECLVMVGIIGLLVAVEPTGALLVLLVLGSAGWLFHRMTRATVTRWGEQRQYHAERSVQHLMQGLGGAKDVKLLGRETEFLDRFRLHHEQSARIGQRQQTLQQVPRLWLELLMITGLTTLVITMLLREGSVDNIVPTLAVFAAAAFRLLPSVNRVLGAVQSLRYDLPALNTLRTELALGAPEQAPRNDTVRPMTGEVVVSGVGYTYPGAAAPSLVDVSLRIGNGESIGLIGPSGSGKSTLVDVILGLLSPTHGTVAVDGRDIAQDMRGWQDQIGYVPQSIYLTDDTLRRNVAFGLADEQIDEEAVERAIHAAQLDELVASLPGGLDTFVGERGIRLSGGQRQRIGIARALYHDPAVLVLDEATSSLDGEAEQSVMDAVSRLQGEKTLLIVAHRLSTVAACDRLYRLERGSVAAQGAPADLLRLAVAG